MQIFVKVLSGREVSLEVDGAQEISVVKKMVETELGVPIDEQRLVFKGSTLTNQSSLNDYSIINNSKLHLFVKKTTKPASSQPKKESLWIELRIFLRKHFNEADTELVLKNFQEDFKRSLEAMNLDDLERLGSYHLKQYKST